MHSPGRRRSLHSKFLIKWKQSKAFLVGGAAGQGGSKKLASAACRRLSSGRIAFLHLRTPFPSKLGFRLHRPRKWLLVLVQGLSMLAPAAAHRREGERRGCPKKDGFSFSSCAQRAPRGPGLAVLKSHAWWDLRANNPDFEKCTSVLELHRLYFVSEKTSNVLKNRGINMKDLHIPSFNSYQDVGAYVTSIPFLFKLFFHTSITQIQQLSRFETLFSLVPFLFFFLLKYFKVKPYTF